MSEPKPLSREERVYLVNYVPLSKHPERSCGASWMDIHRYEATVLSLEREVERLRGALRAIAFASTDVPAAMHGSEASFYRRGLSDAIGTAARALQPTGDGGGEHVGGFDEVTAERLEGSDV